MKKVAVIPPISKSDYLLNTVLDGLIELAHEGEVELRTLKGSPTPFSIDPFIISESAFIEYAKGADLIILAWGKADTNFALTEKISRWDKTVFVDGSELGKDRRFDSVIQKQVADMTYEGLGAIDKIMLAKCKKYFRREKPYINGILPFPFGIETRYRARFNKAVKKDIDFVCIFGQEDFPKMRKEVRLILEEFCKKNNFICATKKTKGFTFDDTTKVAGRNEFYELLARAKVGISVGGGGYDTARFWEILGNNCMLLTEKIDIETPLGEKLDYSRIHEFTTVEDFKKKLEEVAMFLRAGYDQEKTLEEYARIIEEQSTKARVRHLLTTSL